MCLVFIVNDVMLRGLCRLPAYSLCQTGCRSGPTVHLNVLQGAMVVTSKSKKVPIMARPALFLIRLLIVLFLLLIVLFLLIALFCC